MSDHPINKTMDRADLETPACRRVLTELFGLMRRMKRSGVEYSSWYGRVNAWPGPWEHINRGEDYEPWPGNPDELRVPWFLLWEIAWLVTNTPLEPGGRVLDMGGAGSLFSCYLASRGHEVHAIDIDPALCDRANRIARQMGWRMVGRTMDMADLEYPAGFFDHVFSVCVFEHLPVSGRIRCNERIARVLTPGGTASYTFDYANPQSFGRIDTPRDVQRQFVEPSGLRLRGDAAFRDNGHRYLATPPCFGFGRLTRMASSIHAVLTRQVRPGSVLTRSTSYTFGAVFLEKPPSGHDRENP